MIYAETNCRIHLGGGNRSTFPKHEGSFHHIDMDLALKLRLWTPFDPRPPSEGLNSRAAKIHLHFQIVAGSHQRHLREGVIKSGPSDNSGHQLHQGSAHGSAAHIRRLYPLMTTLRVHCIGITSVIRHIGDPAMEDALYEILPCACSLAYRWTRPFRITPRF